MTVTSLDRYLLIALRTKFLHSQKRYHVGSSRLPKSITVPLSVAYETISTGKLSSNHLLNIERSKGLFSFTETPVISSYRDSLNSQLPKLL